MNTQSFNETANGNNLSESSAERTRYAILAKNLSDSLRRTEQQVMAHPYFTAGIVAGIGLAIGGVVAFRASRKETLLDRMLRMF